MSMKKRRWTKKKPRRVKAAQKGPGRAAKGTYRVFRCGGKGARPERKLPKKLLFQRGNRLKTRHSGRRKQENGDERIAPRGGHGCRRKSREERSFQKTFTTERPLLLESPKKVVLLGKVRRCRGLGKIVPRHAKRNSHHGAKLSFEETKEKKSGWVGYLF